MAQNPVSLCRVIINTMLKLSRKCKYYVWTDLKILHYRIILMIKPNSSVSVPDCKQMKAREFNVPTNRCLLQKMSST